MQKKTAKRILEIYCGETGAADLMLAIKKKIPIMIYDRNCSGIDPLLYRALKRIGAPVVQNYDMTMEREGTVSGVYCTVFINNSFANEDANKTITAPDRVGSEAGEKVLKPYNNEKGEFSLGTIHIDKDGRATICNLK